MITHLNQLSILHYNNFIGISDGGEPMSYNDNGNATSFLAIVVDGSLDELFVHSIKSRCGLIKQ